MPFCHSPRNSISKVVSTKRSRATREEETNRVTTRRQKEKRQSKGEVH
jgi:hypothetical protein